MNISADTNVLLRTMVRDGAAQALIADEVLEQAASVSIALSALCEFVWVLRQGYGFSREAAASAVEALMGINNVVVHRAAVEAGLAAMNAGADFADGVSAYEGGRLGGEAFVSFDRKAVAVLTAQGYATRLLR